MLILMYIRVTGKASTFTGIFGQARVICGENKISILMYHDVSQRLHSSKISLSIRENASVLK